MGRPGPIDFLIFRRPDIGVECIPFRQGGDYEFPNARGAGRRPRRLSVFGISRDSRPRHHVAECTQRPRRSLCEGRHLGRRPAGDAAPLRRKLVLDQCWRYPRLGQRKLPGPVPCRSAGDRAAAHRHPPAASSPSATALASPAAAQASQAAETAQASVQDRAGIPLQVV